MTKEQLDAANPEEVLLVDIRESEELLMQPPLSGAVHIPMGNIIREAEDGNLPKDKTIVTICRSGGRCQVTNEALSKLGYKTDLLEGGMMSI
ncbi:MAG: rhodanese-like domain-containing protein [Candidatus Kaiserbacteria bacterium]|nr:rhodanese-like domain-containing protein [Candidatus Kaiserbacteria bacterium]MCB9815971.1 rhodanese-like domain-containing protein [Candidatus Nomurabacteria bacterium]